MKGNLHKRISMEDKFARKYYCQHARLNLLRMEKRKNKKTARRILNKTVYEMSI